MSTYVTWDETSDKGKNQGGQFLKLEAGKKYKVRLVSRAFKYFQHWEPVICRSPGVDKATGQTLDPLMLQGFAPKPRYAIWVFDREDGNRLKVMDFPATLYDQFAEWKANFNDDPGGPNGPDWIIKLEIPGGGDRRRTKYKASNMDRTAFTAEELSAIKEGDLKTKLADLRKANTPDEIRQLMAAKSGDPSGPSSPPAKMPSVPAAPSAEPAKPGGGSIQGFDF